MTGPDRPVTSDDPRLLEQLATVEKMHARYDRELEYAIRARTHLWGAFVMYRLRDPEVELMIRSAEASTLSSAAVPGRDDDRILTVQVGCLVCEQEPDSRNIHRACPGDPTS